MYIIIQNNFRGLFDTYLLMLKYFMSDILGQNVSSAIPLTFIAILQVFILSLFYNTHMGLDEQ